MNDHSFSLRKLLSSGERAAVEQLHNSTHPQPPDPFNSLFEKSGDNAEIARLSTLLLTMQAERDAERAEAAELRLQLAESGDEAVGNTGIMTMLEQRITALEESITQNDAAHEKEMAQAQSDQDYLQEQLQKQAAACRKQTALLEREKAASTHAEQQAADLQRRFAVLETECCTLINTAATAAEHPTTSAGSVNPARLVAVQAQVAALRLEHSQLGQEVQAAFSSASNDIGLMAGQLSLCWIQHIKTTEVSLRTRPSLIARAVQQQGSQEMHLASQSPQQYVEPTASLQKSGGSSPRSSAADKVRAYLERQSGAVLVLVKVAPRTRGESLALRCETESDRLGSDRLVMRRGRDSREFEFDAVVASHMTPQEHHPTLVASVAAAAMHRNVCVVSCGESTAGKSLTMFGATGGAHGVCQAAMQTLLEQLTQPVELEVTAVEIYLDACRDLLQGTPIVPPGSRTPRLSSVVFETFEQFCAIVASVHSRRLPTKIPAAGAIGANSPGASLGHNPWTHCILTVRIKNIRDQTGGTKLTFVDLAGTERPSANMKEAALSEHKRASKGLVAFTDVVMAHATHQAHVPYRNSKLTHTLQESLGTNATILLMMMVHPGESHYTETMSNLSLADRIRDAVQTSTTPRAATQ